MLNNSQLKWFEKPFNIILALIFVFPVGAFFMWKNKMWSLKTRVIISSFAGVLVVLGSLTPPTPRFEYGAFYKVSEVDNLVMPNCDACGDTWYVTFLNENEGYVISTFNNVEMMKKWGGMCTSTFDYYKTETGIQIDMSFDNQYVDNGCTLNFGGEYNYEELRMGKRWTNSRVYLDLDQKIEYVKKYLK